MTSIKLKEHGGVDHLFRRPGSAWRMAICRDWLVAVDRGRGRGWQKYLQLQTTTPELAFEQLCDVGWQVDDSPAGRAIVSRSRADAHAYDAARTIERLEG